MSLFWRKVHRRGPTECWLWMARRNRKGYGEFRVRGVGYLAHRYSYRLHFGDPGSLCVLHACDTPACVNPAHLFIGTRADNNADMRAKRRQAVGARNALTRIPSEVVFAVRCAVGPQSRIAAEFGISQSHVSRIKSGLTRASEVCS